jgi:hypothetical protein
MSMGGAETSAPPIFFLAVNSKTRRATCGPKLLSIFCKSPGVEENFREKTFPCRAFVRHSDTLHPARDPLRSWCLRRGGSRSWFNSQKEKQIQGEEAKDFEGPPRQTPRKARLGLIPRPGTILLKGILQPVRRRGEIGVPGPKTKTGNLAAPRFSAFGFRRSGVN